MKEIVTDSVISYSDPISFLKKTIDEVQEKELELEKWFCYPRKSAKELVEFAVASGKRGRIVHANRNKRIDVQTRFKYYIK